MSVIVPILKACTSCQTNNYENSPVLGKIVDINFVPQFHSSLKLIIEESI